MNQYAIGSNENLAHDPDEEQIALAIVRSALEKGYRISVWEGEDYTIRKSDDEGAIMEALASTGEEALLFHNAESEVRGRVLLVYGNGVYVIADSSTGEEIDAILEPAETLAERLQQEG